MSVGKADTLSETAFDTARREAYEEIGLSLDDSKPSRSFRIEHLCQLPTNLAKTGLAVRPCVAFLHSADETEQRVSIEESLMPRLDAKEVAAVFSAPFRNFLRESDNSSKSAPLWYEGD
jgi:8-oxo-dGTP pyrophosphatase MutT (NUDIX family)